MPGRNNTLDIPFAGVVVGIALVPVGIGASGLVAFVLFVAPSSTLAVMLMYAASGTRNVPSKSRESLTGKFVNGPLSKGASDTPTAEASKDPSEKIFAPFASYSV